MESSQLYELVFQGPQDESMKTLQQIKGVFIGELEYPIADVQNFLATAPVTIKTASTEEELEPALQSLKRAGAKVLIVTPRAPEQPQSGEPTQSDNSPGLVITTDSPTVAKEEASPEVETPTEESGDEAIFEMVLEGEQLIPIGNAPKDEPEPEYEVEPKVYSLSLEESEDAALFSAELLSNNPTIASMGTAETSEAGIGKSILDMAPAHESPALMLSMESLLESEDNSTSLPLSFDSPAAGETVAAPPPQASSSPASPSTPAADSFDLSISLDDTGLTLPDKPAYTGNSEQQEFSEDSETLAVQPVTQEVAEEEPLIPAPEDTALFATEEPIVTEPAAKAPPPPPPPAPAAPVASTPAMKARENFPHAEPEYEPESYGAEEPVKKKVKKRSKIHLELLVSILIGSMIIGVANWYYLSSAGPEGETSTERKLKKSLEDIKRGDTAPAPESPVAKSTLNEFTLSAANANRTVHATLSIDAGKATKIGITLETPAPPELSKEQIVSGAVKAPWLRKIEGSESLIKELPEKGNYQVESPAFAYIEYRGSQKRVALTMKLGISIHPDTSSAQVRYQFVSNGATPPQDLDTLVFEPSGDTYTIFASGTLEGHSESAAASSVVVTSVQNTSSPPVQTKP